MEPLDHGTTLSASARPLGPDRYFLAVVAEGTFFSAPLPDAGQVAIGRAAGNEVWIDDPQISRNHAVLHVSEGRFSLEDLGSANGSRLSGNRLEARERRALLVGQAFELGGTMFVVQRRGAGPERRRLWPHSYFELRLEEECARRGRQPAFAVLWLRLLQPEGAPRLERTLAAELGPSDLVARWVEEEYEVLLFGAGPARLGQLQASLTEALGPSGFAWGVAHPGRDGASADALLEAAKGAARTTASDAPDGPLVEDTAMRDLYRLLDRVARGKISVLLLGETGVGKEVLAESLHLRSPRAAAPFVRFNCGAFTESLLEAELFGYEKGAFTGAERAKPGLLESAEGGTVFLDEVGELSPAIQAKLLRVLERKEVQRLGALQPKLIDVRFVSATNRDLDADVLRGTFRQDLLFRLNGVALTIPPLRERVAEIGPLALRFLTQAAREAGLPVPSIRTDAMEWLRRYRWPGNVRELRNVMERAVLLADQQITPDELPLEKQARSLLAAAPVNGDDDERQRVLTALEACGGNQSRAAQLLGFSRRTLLRRLDELGVPRPRKDAGP